MFTLGTFAIIFDDQKRVLLCHRMDYDLWNLPGGKVEDGESPWVGAIRETKEETGLDVVVEKLSGLYFKPEKNEVCFVFICKVVGGKITLNPEADQIEYFAFENLPKKLSGKSIERIKDALENKDLAVLKDQAGHGVVELIKKGLL